MQTIKEFAEKNNMTTGQVRRLVELKQLITRRVRHRRTIAKNRGVNPALVSDRERIVVVESK